MNNEGTGGAIFNALRPFFESVEAMNRAIGEEWRLHEYKGLRMAAAQRLLEKLTA